MNIGKQIEIQSMPFNTPVPFYDMPVACGVPTETGNVPPVMMMMPEEVVGTYDVYCTRAIGDSMRDLGIHTGDLLVMEVVPEYRSGDVVLAEIDGEKTLKTYYQDEEGRQWLVPSNSDYHAIRLTAGMEVRFCGRLRHHMRRAPQESTRNIRQSIRRELQQLESQQEKRKVTRDMVDAVIRAAGEMVKNGRQWYAVYRPLVDCKQLTLGDYDGFCQEVIRLLPHHRHLPVAEQMQRLAVQSFAKPVVKWDKYDAPVGGNTFERYKQIADMVLSRLS